jgi:diacylglycerol O-acyltransferase-1
MATKIDTATVTGADVQIDTQIRRSAGSHVSLNGFKAPQPLAPIRTHTKKKYRHVAAVHARPRTSCLSHDSAVSPSFLGFRNLMVIVLGLFTTSAACRVKSDTSISRWELAFDDREF